MDNRLNIDIKTYGCKVNTYDSGLLQKRFSRTEFKDSDKHTQVHVLNTCAVTAEATKEAVREIRKLKVKDPDSLIVVTGCAAQVDKDAFENLQWADLVVANSHKGQIEELIQKKLKGELSERVFHSNIFKKEDLEEGGGLEEDHTRSFLKIQDGCNSFCTYCVIPFARGKSRSLSIPNLVERVNELYNQGSREVVLTGVHIGDFEDTDTLGNSRSLEDLVESMLTFTKMPRFRLTSLEPVEVTSRLLELYQDKRLCPHFHMSIQSADTRVLNAMKRKYSAEDIEISLNEIEKRVPGSFVGMDVIVGFPGETDSEFENTYNRLVALPWTRMHVFPYSERPGTKAILIKDKVEARKISERSQRLRDLSQERMNRAALDQIGKSKELLILNSKKDRTLGLSEDYWHVLLEGSNFERGSLLKVKVIGNDRSSLSRMETRLIAEPLP